MIDIGKYKLFMMQAGHGVLIKAEKSGHYVHWDEPELVVQAIHKLIKTIQDKPL